MTVQNRLGSILRVTVSPSLSTSSPCLNAESSESLIVFLLLSEPSSLPLSESSSLPLSESVSSAFDFLSMLSTLTAESCASISSSSVRYLSPHFTEIAPILYDCLSPYIGVTSTSPAGISKVYSAHFGPLFSSASPADVLSLLFVTSTSRDSFSPAPSPPVPSEPSLPVPSEPVSPVPISSVSPPSDSDFTFSTFMPFT